MSDLDLGMNQWMTAPFEYPDKPMDRGKVLWEEDIEKMGGEWARYLDVDGDGIPYRTIPGNRNPRSAYFTRGTGKDEHARYTEDNETWERMQDRLKLKSETARTLVPAPVIEIRDENAPVGMIAFGSTEPAIAEARDQLRERHDLETNFMRIRALPFSPEVRGFLEAHERIYVVEINRDGQLNQILSMEYPALASRLVSVAHLDGLPLTARWVRESILAQEEK
jgi:2-oxoglutarate/2-oxoacid ferredoxin oxidoreductase subunit alpha